MSKNLPISDSSSEKYKSERVYKDLRRRIRELELAPGSRLRKNEFAMEYRVSRAPVSEAIARLAEEGLVDVYPQNGSFVAPIRREDVRESLLIRTGLEVEVVRRATQSADAELLGRLEKNLAAQAEAVRANDMVLLDELDEEFHGIIFAALKSPRAQRLLDITRAMLDRPRFHALPEDGRPAATLAEHRRIVDAIRTGDAELAGAAMRVHLAMVARAIDRDLAETEAQGKLKQVK
ncbi:MAG: GntR family transcriptional regulator [Gammaproteobacteria bacterium]|nr:GntR family transcriptional regulator [Gammaproteobacteria bacterium]